MIPKASDKPDPKEGTDQVEDNSPKVPSAEQQRAFVKKHTDPKSEFGEADRDFVSRLPNSPEPGSITEAALALGLIKNVLHPVIGAKITFEESDVGDDDDPSPATNPTSGPSLEKLTAERGINLPDSILENLFLDSYGVARQTFDAARSGANSPEWQREIITALNHNASRWSQLAGELAVAGESQAPLTEVPDPTTSGAMTTPNVADLRGDDSLILEAQNYADRGRFEEAITRLKMISPDSAMHSVAQEKEKEFSNRGVRELRRKAAQAFQSAQPIADKKVRFEYLSQAKTFLEEAITNFPASTQIPTVRDNLRVITRDLARLEAELEG
jgi:hypothetical protein